MHKKHNSCQSEQTLQTIVPLLQYKDTARHSDAVSAYETAIALELTHASAWNNIALLYEELSKSAIIKL